MRDLSNQTATREILWNLGPVDRAIFYSLSAICVVFTCWVLWRKVSYWKSGKAIPAPSSPSPLLALLGVFRSLLLQEKISHNKTSGLFHFLIVSGCLVLFVATTMVMLEHDFGLPVFRGNYYLTISLLADLFGLGLLLGLLIAAYRRYVIRPEHLSNTRADAVLLSLLCLIVVQGFLLEALRIAATDSPWARYSPIGYALSLPLEALSLPLLKQMHYFLWWFHSLTVLIGLIILPYTKALHLLSSPASLYLSYASAPGTMRFPGDIEQMINEPCCSHHTNVPEDLALGVSNVMDLSQRQRLELDACTSCGRCQSACPAYRSAKPLSPKRVILDTKDALTCVRLEDERPRGKSLFKLFSKLDSFLLRRFSSRSIPGNLHHSPTKSLGEKSSSSYSDLAQANLAGELFLEEVFWSCTTCGACVEQCPVGIDPLGLISEVRRSRVLIDGKPPKELKHYLRNLETRGNPFGAAEDRSAWAAGLSVPIINPGDSVDILYWVGCLAAYDRRKQKIAISMSRILNASGLSWGILGNREKCSGDSARRIGEESLFQQLAKENLNTLASINFKTLVTHCPHCLNTLKNEYPSLTNQKSILGRVIHHSTLIEELLQSKRVSLLEKPSDVSSAFVYHDPCYLGRFNRVFDSPRRLIAQTLGHAPLETEETREKSFCCGAGGGHYWFDIGIGSRINVQRVSQLLGTGANGLATSCPFCLHMLEDGIGLSETDSKPPVLDIAELVAERLS